MNITKAFVERNRLKKFISEKSAILQTVTVWHPKDEGARSWDETGGCSLDALLKTVLNAKQRLVELNIAIDEANAKGGRKLLDELEGLKAQYETLNGLYAKARLFKEKELMLTDGQKILVERSLDIDRNDVSKLLNEVKARIEQKEDEISVFNASMEVELSDELDRYLKEYKNME